MYVWGLTGAEKILETEAISLLPDLEEDVLFEDSLFLSEEESFTASLDEWWGDFIFDISM